MPAKTKKTVLGTLCCVIIFVAWIEAKADRLLTQHEHCLGECRLAQGEGLQRESQINHDVFTSCHHKCPLGRKPHRLKNVKARNRREFNTIQRASVCPVPEPSMEWHPTRTSIKAAIFQYGNSDDWFLNVTWPPMNDSIGTWKNIVFRLKVNTNDFGSDMDCYILPKNQTCFVANLNSLNYKYDNDIAIEIHSLPYNSSVRELYMVYAPRKMTTPPATNAAHPTSASKHMTTPSLPGAVDTTSTAQNMTTTSPLRTVTADPIPGIIKAVAISIGALIGLVLCIYTCNRIDICKKPSPKPVAPEGYEYAAFLVFSSHDWRWMRRILNLLEEHHIKCCVHYKDFRPGIPFVDEMARCVNSSQKVLVLFSKHFLATPFGDFEMRLAIHRMVERRDNCLVIIKIDDVDHNNLPREIRNFNFIDCTSLLERPHWKARVLNLFPHRSKIDLVSGNDNEITERPGLVRSVSTVSSATQISTV
ncbi:uncharacterized protein [Montipora foliosa]|uniref:uncharacterized protein isoform X2 n=1 Tax=Montipora foliosa TaxID=591990 RepID=UPI0035F1663C